MTRPIPLIDLSAQYLSIKEEIDRAIAAVIAETAFVGTASNRFVSAFEQQFAAYTEQRECIACGNGTDALEILLQAAGIGPGDEVLVPALSWIASSEAVTTCGGRPVFVDILPGRYTMDPAAASAKITSRTKAIIPVHLYGLPAEMDEIVALANRHSLFILEDCAQAHGATYRGRKVGSFGHAASYSFFPSKNLGAWGDAGGMTTNDVELGRRARMISQHGQGAGKHDHRIEGRNSRMDGIQASILSVKLAHLEAWTVRRREIAASYRSAFRPLAIAMQEAPPESASVYHLFVIEVGHRDRLRSELAAEGIATTVQYPTALPLLPAYSRYGHRAEDFPVASLITSRIVSIPLYPELSEDEQSRIVDAVRNIVVAARPETASVV